MKVWCVLNGVFNFNESNCSVASSDVWLAVNAKLCYCLKVSNPNYAFETLGWGSSEMCFLSWSSSGCYRVHKSPPVGHILNQGNPGHTLSSCMFTLHFNIIFPRILRSSLSLKYSYQNLVWTSLRCMLCVAHDKPTVADLSEKPLCAKHMLCAWLIAKDDTPLGVLSWPHETGLQVSLLCV